MKSLGVEPKTPNPSPARSEEKTPIFLLHLFFFTKAFLSDYPKHFICIIFYRHPGCHYFQALNQLESFFQSED